MAVLTLVVQRWLSVFLKDGLVVLRNAEASDVLMRIIYATWLSLGSERGLNFLEFVLTMLWADKWKLIRLWHSISKVQAYPRFLSDVRKRLFLNESGEP